jgi:hypothetical protein
MCDTTLQLLTVLVFIDSRKIYKAVHQSVDSAHGWLVEYRSFVEVAYYFAVSLFLAFKF